MKNLASISYAVSLGMALLCASTPSRAEGPVLLHAAGSLREALTAVGTAFEKDTGLPLKYRFGASGLVKDEIVGGAKAEVFASANMEHPLDLASAKRSGPVVLFVRNRLCLLAKPGVKVSTETVLDTMLDPDIKLGTSTPKNDPSGDYAWEIFKKAEALRPGSFAKLDAKALQLAGRADSQQPPPGQTLYGMLIATRQIDTFLTYCTNAMAAKREDPQRQMIALPDTLSVAADYGLTVLNGSSPDAYRFAMYILSKEGQTILSGFGFETPNKP